jgi:ubiquinone/menaquinone biosynthesis C-methylase UbiE
MTHREAVSFIQGAIAGTEAQNWADLGCGSGTFTKALIDLLPEGSKVVGVDRENQRLNLENVRFAKADFEKDELSLSGLDGILIANALHYIADKGALIKKLEPLFSSVPRFIVIEYDTERPNLWVPYPFTFERLSNLSSGLGYRRMVKINERRSAYGSGHMYCALIEK